MTRGIDGFIRTIPDAPKPGVLRRRARGCSVFALCTFAGE
jgi:hypothetical protein